MEKQSKSNDLVSKANSGLRTECLSFTEVIAQSIANIAPSATPAFTIPLVFALSGNGSWLTYVFATIAIALVGHHINQFAKRSSSPGALYTYVGEGLGGRAGFISGWALILGYVLTGTATLAAFSSFLNTIGEYFGITIPSVLAIIIGIILAWFVVSRDVKISAKLMLVLEGISLTLIFILGAIVVVQSGFKLDMTQLSLEGVSFDSLRLGLVLAFFSFVGFESATSLGHEAKNPLKNIPKSVITSAVFVGFIFVLFSYIEVLGFIGSETSLGETAAPLSYLADKTGFGFMGFIISIGATVSFWSCTVACITASARVILTMSQDNIISSTLGKTHSKHKTPYVSINLLAIVSLVIPVILSLCGIDTMEIFSWLGTIATLGFLFSYAMIVISAPVYLAKINQLKKSNMILSAITMAILLIPIIGSVYPLPAYPFNIFPFIFLAWIVIGGIWYEFSNATQSSLSKELDKDAVVNIRN
ncbi:APC family permease [Clostridium beijerinckii]|uniref:Amino acid permease/ SLC12A domain-containing protein n=1 Tax=Clostridium beijerinckii TaxID=1520 RepID=A0A1S9N5G5_CLOBE|nr:APC family permease [Clostridium beijerinckii]OOP72784.1 hypothetical protein CBEIBR21_13260 [Clostridium beijerinckii]